MTLRKLKPPYGIISLISHVTHGFMGGILTGFLGWFGFFVSIFLYVQFFVYEYFEEQKIKDELYHECKEWSIGYVLGLISSLIAKFIL